MVQAKKWYDAAVFFRAGVIFYMLFTVLCAGLPFWGDQVTLVSIPAQWLYAHPGNWILPEGSDTGHPPFYGLIVALAWLLAGKNLLVAHLVTLLTVLLLFTQYYLLCKRYVPEHIRWLAVLLFLFQPVILAQTAAMSPDLFLSALFLMGLEGLASGREKKLYAALLLMPLFNLRGWMLDIALILLLFLHTKTSMRTILTAGLMLLPACCWLVYHHAQAGWWLAPAQGYWSHGRSLNDLPGIAAKAAEYIVRNVAFGMFVPWICILFHFLRKKPVGNVLLARSIWVVFLVLIFFLLPFRNPILVRYLLPLMLPVLLFFSGEILAPYTFTQARRIGLLMILLFLSYHFWAYPRSNYSLLTNDWGNGSLAHLSIFKLEEQMQDSLAVHDIPIQDVYAAFPEYKDRSDMYLVKSDAAYRPFSPDRSVSICGYFLYSNVMNGLPDSTVHALFHWTPVIKLHAYPVDLILYQNPAIQIEQFP
ncbi:MAG: hypothetical protein R2794_04105 [Chitinophagales bacterium]